MTIPSTTRLNLSAAVASVTVAVVLVLLKLWALGETGALSVAASLVRDLFDVEEKKFLADLHRERT